MTCFHLVGQMAARLGDNFDSALYKPLPLPISVKKIERYIPQNEMNAFDRLDDIHQSGDDRSRFH